MLKERLEELKESFRRSGCPEGMVQGIMGDVLKRPRNLEYKIKDGKPPYPVMWVQTYSSGTENIRKIVKRANTSSLSAIR